jgi:ribosomal protein S18 acetylase RimI-like enzyme
MALAVRYHHLTPANAHLIKDCAAFDNPVDPASLAAFLADSGHEMVFAETGGAVAGFASGTVLLHPDKPPAFFINEVGVVPEMRRKGIAAALCKMLIGIARDRGCRGIWLATEGDNAAARALYRRLGGRETPDIAVYDWDDAMDG